MTNYIAILEDRLTGAQMRLAIQATMEYEARALAAKVAEKLDLNLEDVVVNTIPKGKK